ncbi:MAG: DUF1292 domain-containing protein [Ruminococcaceae bacterium]|nr:DUF1292 domain-containing protein [Oscillospiraceae bacterium]
MNEFTKYSEENESNIIPFMDEDGNKIDLELIDAFEMQGNEYVALVPADDDDEECEVMIMRIEHDDEEDILVYIEDEDELDNAFDIFKDRMGDEFDFID